MFCVMPGTSPGMTNLGGGRYVNAPHNIPDSSSSAFSISSSLTTTIRRGTMKIMLKAQATEMMKIADVSGSVVAEWPPR
jgi:hypothetical protein